MDPEVTIPPVKKARKPKAAKPAPAPKSPRKPRLEPARTLRRRIDDLGAYCLEAFDRQRKRGGDDYEKEVRDALDSQECLVKAKARADAARMALAEAATALVDAENDVAAAGRVLDRLYASAKVLAGLDGGDDTTKLDPDGRDEGAET